MPETKRLHVLSYNIHKGFTSNNARFILNEIRQAIRTVDAELVFLQEVLGDHAHHGRKHHNWIPGAQFEYLADDIWPHYAYGKNAIYQHGHHGNAILCKLPFSFWENTDISQFRHSQRGFLHGIVANALHVFCLHLGLMGFERRNQINMLIKTIREKVPDDAPLIIAGDFNDWHCSIDRKLRKELGVKEAFRELQGRPARTFPVSLPFLQLDRIYYRGLNLQSADVLKGEHWQQLSDHCALRATFDVPLEALQIDDEALELNTSHC